MPKLFTCLKTIVHARTKQNQCDYFAIILRN